MSISALDTPSAPSLWRAASSRTPEWPSIRLASQASVALRFKIQAQFERGAPRHSTWEEYAGSAASQGQGKKLWKQTVGQQAGAIFGFKPRLICGAIRLSGHFAKNPVGFRHNRFGQRFQTELKLLIGRDTRRRGW